MLLCLLYGGRNGGKIKHLVCSRSRIQTWILWPQSLCFQIVISKFALSTCIQTRTHTHIHTSERKSSEAWKVWLNFLSLEGHHFDWDSCLREQLVLKPMATKCYKVFIFILSVVRREKCRFKLGSSISPHMFPKC